MSTVSRSRRRGTRTPRRSMRNRRNAIDENHEPDVQVINEEQPSCIDLTGLDDSDIVDLTSSVSESPILILPTPPGPTTSSRLRRHNRDDHDSGSDSDLDLDLELPPFDPGGSPSKKPREDSASAATSSPVLSPEGKGIRCPICFDNDKQIKASKRRIFSTICGHIFCSECIEGAIKAQKCCPTCRKKLSLKNIHPLFI